MSIIGNILLFVLVLGALVFFHELGHFLASKALGIEVEEFGFGYPPRLAKLFTWKGTVFTLNWIPFGGFTRPKGETDAGEPGSILAAPAWKRLLIFLGGPIMNFIVGILVLAIMFTAVGTPDATRVLISDIAPNSPAASVQIQPGDILQSINGTDITSMDQAQSMIQDNLGKEISITVLRGSSQVTFNVTPRENPPAGQGALGVGLTNPLTPLPLGRSVGESFITFGEQVKQTLLLPVNLINGTTPSSDARVVGIVGIFDIFNNASQLDQTNPVRSATPLPVYTLSVISTVAIALGITNLLPIPALDGGQILLLLPELLFKKRIPQNVVNTLNSVFFLVLIVLMIYITFQDVFNPIIQP